MIGARFVNRLQLSPNHEARVGGEKPSLIVLHYTGMQSGTAAVDWLCNPASKVSCHYLVDDDGSIVQMVDENRRAWHAGVSSWNGREDINSASIGIEIQNAGHAAGLPAFSEIQMQSVAKLCLDIMHRHELPPHCVVAHSDIAPGRKIDPGEAFNWAYLARFGIGQTLCAIPMSTTIALADAQEKLRQVGYGLPIATQSDERTRIVISAFQRRYRADNPDGVLDAQTSALLLQLIMSLPHSP